MVLEDTKEIDEIVLGGDFNGETGVNTGDPALGIHGVGLRNKNGERLVEYANTRGLSIVASNFIKKDVKKYTMRGNFQVDEGGRKFREYDHFLVRSRDKRTIKDVKNRWDTFHHSDHSLRVLYIEMKPCGVRDMKRNNNISVRLRSLEGGIAVNEELKRNNYKDLMDETSNISLEERWYKLKEGIKKGLESCPKNEEKRKPWISQDTWTKMKLRNEMWERVEKGTNHYGHLLEVRKEVKRMLKADKREWLRQQTEKAENAARVNNLKELYAIIRMLSGKRYSGVDLTGMDMNAFISHFESLLGRQIPDERSEYKQRRAFHLAKNSSEIIGKEWSIDNTPPSDDEIIKMCKKMRNNKAVGMDELPTELFKNSEECQKVLGIIIRAFWRGEKLVEEHYTAILVTLFKGKGSRREPGGYRGISLLSFVERIISLIILERVKEAVEKRLLKHQYGFTSGKSCRDPVRLLWNKWESTMKIASVFVDFQKAFDSLVWTSSWKILAAAGMPKFFVELIRRLYDDAKVTIRINKEGKVSDIFDQKIGVRQGSCLSPIIFILVLDHCIRAAVEACEERGFKVEWLGYADDLYIAGNSAEEVEFFLQELQAAAYYVGLMINGDKTVVMAKGMTTKSVLCKGGLIEERVAVKWDDGIYEGWLRPVADDDLDSRFHSTHQVIYDDGSVVAYIVKKAGWIQDEDGDKLRITRLGFNRLVDGNDRWKCSSCGSTFHNKKGLNVHNKIGNCRQYVDMSINKQRALRKSRMVGQYKRGVVEEEVENIEIKLIDGHKLKCVGSMVYLGTLITTKMKATGEINRRIGRALGVFNDLKNIWRAKGISLETKKKIFGTCILSVLLYNGETWIYNKNDIGRLQRCCNKMVCDIIRWNRRGDDDTDNFDWKVAEVDITQWLGGLMVKEMLGQKRLRWFGHAMRQFEGSVQREWIESEITSDSKWIKLVREDIENRGGRWRSIRSDVMDKKKWHYFTNIRSAHVP